MLIVDKSLSDLLQTTQKESTASEADILNILSQYSISDSLISFGTLSRRMFLDPNLEGRINITLLADPSSGVLISQFALSYLSSMAILSGNNDSKPSIDKPEMMNVAGMNQIYNNCLPAAFNKDELEEHGPATFLMRMYTEQFSYQISAGNMFAKTFIIFLEIAPKINKKNLDQLNTIHVQETGLNIIDLLWISFSFFTLLQKNSTNPIKEL